jgi:hypothetical protein
MPQHKPLSLSQVALQQAIPGFSQSGSVPQGGEQNLFPSWSEAHGNAVGQVTAPTQPNPSVRPSSFEHTYGV